ncbi:DNA cytosine methyltransferase [Flavobacterium praedii]|uniref:DNA cytosine methyltransferase n=1 Tax=Flavobacterium praedii TaxID=3002900 RepID=UPI002481DD84|nr:DNA cytosine methyltransferase [Flavobacterium praedii]
MDFRLGELFCGPGGIAIGARDAAFEHNGEIYSISHEWANDYEKDTCETYSKNICPENVGSVICEDVRKLDIDNLSQIDGLAFGFPCNDFSIVGEQKGFEGNYGPLYTYGIKALNKFQPSWFLAENVGGLRNSNDGNAFQTIIDELTATGYNVVANLYKFENYEVPQARHRIIIVGIRNDLGLTFKVPIIKNPKTITSREAIEIPSIPTNAPNNELTRQSENVIERLKHIKPGQNAFNATIPDHLKLNVKGAQISQIYKRLDPNKPAYTVTGSGGGGTHIYHWEENRALTNRERARLQTFPDDFVFCGSKESVRKQIGMAVPPKGVKLIFESILKTFARIPYDSVLPNIETRNRDLFGKMVMEPTEDYITN